MESASLHVCRLTPADFSPRKRKALEIRRAS